MNKYFSSLSMSVTEIENQVSLYRNIKMVFSILCILFLVISIILLVVFKIPKIISIKTGLAAKRTIKEFENGIEKDSRTHIRKYKVDSKESADTTILPENLDGCASTIVQETTIMESIQNTSILDDGQQTTLLELQDSALAKKHSKRKFVLEKNIVVIHTEEVV